MGAEANHAGELKHLEFVRSYTGYFWGKTSDMATYVYSSGRAYTQQVPKLDNSIKGLEGAADKYATPWIVTVQDTSEKTLKILDDKVDGALNVLALAVEKQRAVNKKNIAWFNGAKEQYLNKVNEATAFLHTQGLQGAARATVDALAKAAEDAKKIPSALTQESQQLMAKISDFWHKLSHYPAVSRSVETFQPRLESAWKSYISAHDSVAASPMYHRAVDTTTQIVQKAQETSAYRAAATNLYPRVSPWVDPLVDRIVHSPSYEAVANHLKPLPNGTANGHIPSVPVSE